MKRQLERRRTQLEERNARMFGKLERCIAISELSVQEQEHCFAELLDELEAVQTTGGSYRSFTGGSLEKYCRRLMEKHRGDCQPQRQARYILYVMGMALVAGFLIALVERIGWKSGSLLTQQISIWLVYGMALTEQLVDQLLRRYLQRSIFRGQNWPYEHRGQLEWLVLICCYGVFGGVVFLSPLYRIVTSLTRMLWLFGLGAVVYGLCLAVARGRNIWMPLLQRIRDRGRQNRAVSIGMRLIVILLLVGGGLAAYRYLTGADVVLYSILIVVLLFGSCIVGELQR